MINFCQPNVGDDELAAVRDVFASRWLGNGERASLLEEAFARYIGCAAREVVAISSCTEGLFQAVAACDLGPADEVVLPSISFVGAAHAVRNSGARVALCDVDPTTLNPTVEHIERAITPATKAILILHYAGDPGAVAEISRLAEEHSLVLIEDAALALGASVDGRTCGTIGDIGVWSFDAMKPMTTGDGGMMWCSSVDTADRVRATIRMGVGSSGFARRSTTSRWWEIDPPHVGRRATLNDIAAAIGLVQLARLPAFLHRRRELASAYTSALRDIPWLRVRKRPDADATWTFYPVQAEDGVRDRLATHLLEHGIYTNFRYWPLHRMDLYRAATVFPGADQAARTTLLLPLHASLSEADVEQVVHAIHGFVPSADQ